MSMIPGEKKFNLHASYANLNGRKIERSEYTADLFSEWMDWARSAAWVWTSTPPTSRIPW